MVDSTNPIFVKGEKNVTFKVDGNEDGHAYYISNESKLGLVVISEWWGHNKSINTTAEIFAKQGLQVIVPDIYRGETAIDREHAGHLMNGLNFKSAVQDIIGCVRFLKTKGCDKVAVSGFCMGGALALATAASSDELFAVLPYYGIPDQSYFPVKNIKCPVLYQSGSLDYLKGFSDQEHSLKIKEEAVKAGVKYEIKIWEGADHAFMNQDSEKYHKEVAAKSLELSVNWLKSLNN